MNSSLRGAEMPPSPIRKLAPFADAAKAQGVEVLHLNIGQPDIATPESFWEGVKEGHVRVLEYSPSPGIPKLRQAMAEHYQSIGINVTASQLLVTVAGSEALNFAMQACLDEGDEVIVPEPMYANYIGFAKATGVKVKPLTTRIEEDFALPSPEAFAAEIGPRTKAILICNPSNPTGTIYSDEQLDGLRDLAIKHNLFIISDEVYRTFNYTDRPLRSVLQLEGLEEHAIMVDSVSKRYSLCGARIGFLVTRNAKVLDAAARFAMARLAPPGLEQSGVLGALKTPPSYFEEVRTEYMARRDLMLSRLAKIPGVLVPKIEGAFYATVRLPIDDCDKFCQWLLEDFRHEGRTVMLAPASGFYETPGLGKDEVRLAYVLNQEKLSLAMDALEEALKVYPGRTN